MNPARLTARLMTDPAGVLESPGPRDPIVVVHYGPPVEIGCERGGQHHRGVSVHGDIDIIPAGMPSRWTLKKQDTAFVIRLSQDLLTDAAAELNIDRKEAVLLNRFQMRDPKLEHLAWALKAEIEDGSRTGRSYTESIGWAMACQLLSRHSVASRVIASPNRNTNRGSLAAFRLKRVLAFIEEDLARDLSLAAIAGASGLSISHCQRAFRRATGMSIHQYVIRRRVDRAKALLTEKQLPLSEVALRVGFSHQSHLAFHTRRLLGVSPLSLRETVHKARA